MKLSDRNRSVNNEMDRLGVTVEALSNLDDNLVSQLQNLNLQVRRTQRQLSSQISSAESDIESLEKGMRKVAMIKEAIES